MNQTLHRIARWSFAVGLDWLGLLIYRYRCPYPINGHNSARGCFRSGNCGCDNQARFRALSQHNRAGQE